MTNTKFDKASHYLYDLWLSKTQCLSLPEPLRPKTLEEGYEIQNRLIESIGSRILGWKLGVGSEAQLSRTHLKRPLVGQVFEDRVFGSGGFIDLPQSGSITVECEIGLYLSRDISSDPEYEVSADDIADIIFTFEIVRSRFKDRLSVGWPSFVADNVGFEALILGCPLSSNLNNELVNDIAENARIELDGSEVSGVLKGKDSIDPIKALSHLAKHACEHNFTLKQGDIVTTGAYFQPFELSTRGHEVCFKMKDYELKFLL